MFAATPGRYNPYDPHRVARALKREEMREDKIPTTYLNEQGDEITPPSGELTEAEKNTTVYMEGCDAHGPFQKREVVVKDSVEQMEDTGLIRCPIHPQYGMRVKEIKTCRGLRRLHHCPQEECIVACFGEPKDLEQFVVKVEEELHDHYKDVHCPLICYCNELLCLKTSFSQKNPGRLYLTCQKGGVEKGGCKMFQWGDEWPRQWIQDHWWNYANN